MLRAECNSSSRIIKYQNSGYCRSASLCPVSCSDWSLTNWIAGYSECVGSIVKRLANRSVPPFRHSVYTAYMPSQIMLTKCSKFQYLLDVSGTPSSGCCCCCCCCILANMAGLKGNWPLPPNNSFRLGRRGGAPPPPAAAAPNIVSIAGKVASDAAKGAPSSSLGSASNGRILFRDLKVSVDVLGAAAAKAAGDGEGDRRCWGVSDRARDEAEVDGDGVGDARCAGDKFPQMLSPSLAL